MARPGADHDFDHAHWLPTQARIVVDRALIGGSAPRARQCFGQVAIQAPACSVDHLAMHFVGGVPGEHARYGRGDLDRSAAILHCHQLDSDIAESSSQRS